MTLFKASQSEDAKCQRNLKICGQSKNFYILAFLNLIIMFSRAPQRLFKGFYYQCFVVTPFKLS